MNRLEMARVGEIYCLFSTQDGVPRYVGQTEERSQKRRRHHIARALDQQKGDLHDWIRSVFEAKHDIGLHVLQSDIAPGDLNMFEGYWIQQFTDLLNIRRNSPRLAESSNIGRQVIEGIRSRNATPSAG